MKVLYVIHSIGGLDGVALQYENYCKMFSKYFGYDIFTITGITKGPRPNLIISDMQIRRKYLFEHQSKKDFTPDWEEKLLKSVRRIKKHISKTIEKNKPGLVILHNVLSLSDFHINTYLALQEIVQEHPHLQFISMAPDSMFERPERLEKMHDTVKKYIFHGLPPGKFPAPNNFKNLIHIVLNSNQLKRFREFGIKNVYQIPDFEDFKIRCRTTNKSFLKGIEPDYFILFAVRPVWRKKILETLLLGYHIQKQTGLKLIFVITHPDLEEGGTYLQECKDYAQELGLELIYMGDDLNVKYTLEQMYANFSKKRTLGFVASNMGGWENVTIELAKYKIPVFINPDLQSYPDMKKLGLCFQELPISDVDIKNKNKVSSRIKKFITHFSELDYAKLKDDAEHNYKVSKENLSIKAAYHKWKKILDDARKT